MSNGNPFRSLLSRAGRGIRQGLTSIQSAFRRGLSIPGVQSLLRAVGLAPTPPPPLQLRTASGRRITEAEASIARAARQALSIQFDAETIAHNQALEALNQRNIVRFRANQALKRLPSGQLIPFDLIQVALGRQRKNFAYIVSVFAVERSSGEPVTRTITLSTNDLLSTAEALRRAELIVEESPIRVTGSELEDVITRGRISA